MGVLWFNANLQAQEIPLLSDLGTWMPVLLNKGKWNDKVIIPENAINKMWLSHTIIGKSRAADHEMYFKTYGLGWEIMQYPKHRSS